MKSQACWGFMITGAIISKQLGAPMKKFMFRSALFSVLSLLLVLSAVGQGQQIEDDDLNKRAQTGMKFLQMSVDARASGMAGAMTAMEQGASAMFYNPASMARISNSLNLSLGQVQWFEDVVYNYGSLAFAPAGGDYGVFGAFIMAVDYGEFLGTIRADTEDGFVDTGAYSPSAISAGISYAKDLSDRFAVGGNIKYVYQDLTSSTMTLEETQGNSQGTVAFDLGVLYNTGFESLNFAMSARNFSSEVTYEEEAFELPLTFTIGLSMDMLDLTEMNTDLHSFVLSVDAERPRDFYEHMNVGGEYILSNTFSLRAGYAFPTDEEGISLGVGVKRDLGGFNFDANYAFTDWGVFGSVSRISLNLGF